MKKLLLGLLIVIVLIAIGAFFMASKMDEFIAQTIETEGSKALGVPVTVGQVEVKLAEGSASFTDLAIGNPAGYNTPTAFKINQFSTSVDYKNREIAEILIANPVITAEFKGTNSNFKDIADNLPESEDTTEETSEESSSDVDITIQAIKITQATVQLIHDQLGQQQFVMDDLVMRNLSGTPEHIAQSVADQLTNHISSQATRFVSKQVEERVKAEVKEKVSEKVSEKLTEELGGKLGGALKNLNFQLK